LRPVFRVVCELFLLLCAPPNLPKRALTMVLEDVSRFHLLRFETLKATGISSTNFAIPAETRKLTTDFCQLANMHSHRPPVTLSKSAQNDFDDGRWFRDAKKGDKFISRAHSFRRKSFAQNNNHRKKRGVEDKTNR